MTLLIGDATTTYSNTDQVDVSVIQVWKFTAAASGTVDTLAFRTNSTANTGVTSVILGIYADNGSGTSPGTGAALVKGTSSGTPATNTWVTVSGLALAVTLGTVYWLAALPIGAALHYNSAVTTGGTQVDTSGPGETDLVALGTGWSGPFPTGPAGFQGTSSVVTGPSFMPGRMPLGA